MAIFNSYFDITREYISEIGEHRARPAPKISRSSLQRSEQETSSLRRGPAGPGNPMVSPKRLGLPDPRWGSQRLGVSRRHGGRGSGWVAVGCCFSAEGFRPRADGGFMGFHGSSRDFMLRGFNHHQEFGLHGSVNG